MADHAPRASVASIEAIGMVASLGLDAATICAASRAGIDRASVLENYHLRSEVEGDPEPVIGHAVPLLTRGFEGQARQIRLAQGALTDLMRNSKHIDWHAQDARFFLALPDIRRLDWEMPPPATSPSASPPQGSAPVDASDPTTLAAANASAEGLLQRAAVLAGWPVHAEVAFRSFDGRVAALRAIEAAIEGVNSGAVQIAVVLAVDSWLDEETLDWLHGTGRLKCDGVPNGLRPGEAGVAIALRAASNSVSHPRNAEILAVEFAEDSRAFESGKTPIGESLAAVVGALWARIGGTFPPWILSDQNGENYRAVDWGFAAVKLRARFEAFGSPILWFPALNVGDTGVAGSLVAICLALRAWQRGYAPAPNALVFAANDGPGRAALWLRNTMVGGTQEHA